MSTIVTRAGKGAALTHTEVDTNFTNLNTDKYQSGDNASFGTLSASGNVTLSGGTANGVLYLNASKVATSGSALTFDGTRLGVGTASPDTLGVITTEVNGNSLNVSRTTSTTGRAGWVSQNSAETIRLFSEVYGASATNTGFGLTLGGYAVIQSSGTASNGLVVGTATNDPLIFGQNDTEAMRLTSTGLGIGTSSPGEKLNVIGGGSTTSTVNFTGGINNDNATIASDYSLVFQVDANNNVGGRAFNWRYGGKGYSDGTSLMTLAASGNLLLGSTTAPTGFSRLSLVGGESSGTGANSGVQFTYNSSTYGGGAITTVNAAGGGMSFYTFTGNVGSEAYTERARITSGGWSKFSDNGTYVNTGGDYHEFVRSSAATTPVVITWNKVASGDNQFIQFGTDATYTNRGNIDFDRANGLVRYNTTSDYRAKDIIGPVQNVGETIDALKVYEGLMKGATQSRPMLVAHEAQEYAPYAVSGVKDEMNEDGTPKYQQMDVSALVPLLLAEVQSLRKRVAELETK